MAGKKRKKLSPKKPPGRRYVSSADWSPAFLATLRETANVRASCEAAGVTRPAVYARRASDPAFAAAWEDATNEAVDKLEEAARTRALSISDTLLIFLLKCHRPAVYRDRVEVSQKTTLEVVEEIVDGDPA